MLPATRTTAFVYCRRIGKCKHRLSYALLKITNAVFKGKLPSTSSLDLNLLHLQIPTASCSTFYQTQPQMLTISTTTNDNRKCCKLIFFKSCKFRLMGGGFLQQPSRNQAYGQLHKFYPLLAHAIVCGLKGETYLSNYYCNIFTTSVEY